MSANTAQHQQAPPQAGASVADTIPVSKHTVRDLLTWKNPQETAKVFGVSLATLLALKYVNLVHLFFRFAFISLFVAGAGEYAGKLLTGQGFASRFKPAHYNRVSAAAHHVLPRLEAHIETLEAELQSVFFATDIEKTLKVAALSYVFYKITSWVSFFSLLVISLVAAFTVPAAYVSYEKEIHEAKDKYCSLAKSKAGEYKHLAHERSKPYVSQVSSKLSPYTQKASAFLPNNRTAGSTVGPNQSANGASSSSAGVAAPGGASSAGSHADADADANTQFNSDDKTSTDEPSVGTASGANAHTTSALPKAPTSDPVNAQSVDVDDLRASIQKDKATVGL